MTSQKDQIQALITDIDGVLQKTTPRLPWVVSGEVTQQRQVLERVRNYLVAFQRRLTATEGFGQTSERPDLLAHDIYYQPPQSAQGALSGDEAMTAQQMLQTVMQEMSYLRSSLMQPLQSDLDYLRQQRDSLMLEIRQLEAQRQAYPLGPQAVNQQQMMAEFLQALMARLQETLPQQVAQALSGRDRAPELPYEANPRLAGAPATDLATTGGYYQGQLQPSQAGSDELLMRLDSTLRVVFDSLQQNVQAYQESLSQGLDKMHSLGQQGEMMFTALVNHLAQQLGREASSYIQSSALPGLEAARSTPAVQPPIVGAAPTSTPTVAGQTTLGLGASPPTANVPPLPFPGTELPSPSVDSSTASDALPSVDTAIDSWLRSAGTTAPPTDTDLDITNLNLEDFDLNQLADQDIDALLALDANLAGTNLPPQPMLAPIAPAAEATPTTEPPTEDTADIDAALKLLEQLSADLQDEPASIANADAEIDRMLSSNQPLASEPVATEGVPEDARDELDEFYESLFGSSATTGATTDTPTATPSSTEAPAPSTAPVSPMTTAPLADTVPTASDSLPTAPPTADSAEPVTPSAPVEAPAAITDPTLGWDLLATSPSAPVAEFAAQPVADLAPPEARDAPPEAVLDLGTTEIPDALLEDELLSGWDLSEAEDVTPAAPVAEDELLSGWDTLPTTADAPDAATPSTVSESLAAAPQPEVPPPASSADSITAPAADTISALTDLFGDAEEPSPPLAAPIAPATDAATTPVAADAAPSRPLDQTEDRYIPALPEEDLLPVEQPVEEPEPELWLDESTLTRLSEDLFNLEDAFSEPSPPFADESGIAFAPDQSQSPVADDRTDRVDPPSAPIDQVDLSLDAFTAALAAEPEAGLMPEITPAPESAPVTLDGMDDLFGDVPTIASPPDSSSPVAPAPPPDDSPAPFTLEGMDDLFADVPPTLPPVTPVPPPVPSLLSETQTPFTLEGIDTLFSDVPSTTPAPPVSEEGPNQPPPFSLEGMDDLFSDVPAVTPPVPPAAPDATTPFTLDRMDDLFTDAPPIAPEPTVAPEAPLPTADPLELPLPTLDEQWLNEPSVPPVSTMTPVALPTPELTPFTMAQVDDVFVEVPAGASVPSAAAVAEPSPESVVVTPAAPIATFTIAQVGDLFMELPTPETTAPSAAVASPPDTGAPPAAEMPAPEPVAKPTETFNLDQAFDSLLAPPPAATPPAAEMPTLEPTAESTETFNLDQAFESLLGMLGVSEDVTESTGSDPAVEKKKGMIDPPML